MFQVLLFPQKIIKKTNRHGNLSGSRGSTAVLADLGWFVFSLFGRFVRCM